MVKGKHTNKKTRQPANLVLILRTRNEKICFSHVGKDLSTALPSPRLAFVIADPPCPAGDGANQRAQPRNPVCLDQHAGGCGQSPSWITRPLSLPDALNISLQQNGTILKAKNDLE